MQKGCPKCGRMIDQNYEICPYCNYDFKEMDNFFKKVNTEKFIEDEKYAGFIKRLVAGMLDIELILLLTYLVLLGLNTIIKIDIYNPWIFISIYILLYILINSALERTKWHGSVGKYIVEIEVTDEYENPVTFGLALKRNIIKFINLFTLGIGFLLSVTPPKRQTLSDKITKTYVLNKVKLKEEKLNDIAPTYKRLIAFIIDICVIALFITIEYYAFDFVTGKLNIINEKTEIIKLILATLIGLLYFPFNEGKRGQTVGKKWLKIKLADMNEENISFLKALVRELLMIVDIISLGFLLPLGQNKNQTIKDILTGTFVINY